MKIRGEYKVPIEYMPPKACCDDWCKKYVADAIRDHMIEQGLIEFTEEWRNGYYIFSGEVLCENPIRARELGEQLLRLSIDNQNKI